jgi:hypothetical protein
LHGICRIPQPLPAESILLCCAVIIQVARDAGVAFDDLHLPLIMRAAYTEVAGAGGHYSSPGQVMGSARPLLVADTNSLGSVDKSVGGQKLAPNATDRHSQSSRLPQLVVLLRNPLDRVHCAYWHHVHYHSKYGRTAEGFLAYATEQLAALQNCTAHALSMAANGSGDPSGRKSLTAAAAERCA